VPLPVTAEGGGVLGSYDYDLRVPGHELLLPAQLRHADGRTVSEPAIEHEKNVPFPEVKKAEQTTW
jgi:hypothetical protein